MPLLRTADGVCEVVTKSELCVATEAVKARDSKLAMGGAPPAAGPTSAPNVKRHADTIATELAEFKVGKCVWLVQILL